MLAERAVRAPNFESDRRGVDTDHVRLKEQLVWKQLRISVGPPDATIAVHITEPHSGPEEINMFGKGRQIEAIITRRPSTRPTTSPTVYKGTVVFIHGIQDYKEMGPYVLYREMLASVGYRCVQVDLRGHGRSTGDWITYGVVEARDMVQVLDELERQHLVEGEVGALGVSYGATVAIQWAAIDPRVKAVVAMEPFCDFRTIAHDAANFVLGKMRWMFSDQDIDNAVDQAGRLAHFNPAEASAVNAIQQTRAQVLLVHSKTDELIPWSHSQRLHDAAPMHSKLILMNGQSHFNLWIKSMDVIRGASLAWFDRHLGENDAHYASAPERDGSGNQPNR
jgi:pimeloyl-ACP methyl ester carboxylesterase